jgi:hypothetical protein
VICRAANALWLSGCVPEAVRFRRATARVRVEQARVLRRLLHDNAATEFGRRHGFARIASVHEYQQRVPLRTYEDYGPAVEHVAAGIPNVLTREPVRLLEPTSGSTGATKLVPYTASLQREFQTGIRSWIADLFRHQPALMAGQAYWSASPVATANARSPGGIPIGFDDDASYVGGWQQRLVGAVMAVPAAVRHIADMDAFRYATLLALVRSANLRLMSVWNPTFLTLLLERLPDCGDALARDLRPDPRRADALGAALRAATPAERHAILWPRLSLISCWTDASAATPAVHLASLFPHARIQGKGLIATEAFISLPLAGHAGSALAVRSHFLEFIEVNAAHEWSSRAPFLAHELEPGRRYAVVVSTGGGFYRYQLDDVVEVVGRVAECPLIRFIGRRGHVSDFFGEKLNEAYVTAVLHDTLDACGIAPAFAMLACDDTLSPPAYVLYIETNSPADVLERLARGIESGLRAAFHYDYARRLAQLGPLRVFRADGAGDLYLGAAVRGGQRAGNVKPRTLDCRTGWSQILRGHFIAMPR